MFVLEINNVALACFTDIQLAMDRASDFVLGLTEMRNPNCVKFVNGFYYIPNTNEAQAVATCDSKLFKVRIYKIRTVLRECPK